MLYRRFYGGDELDQVLLTMGLIFMSVARPPISGVRWRNRCEPPELLRGQINLFGHALPAYRTFLILCGAIIVTLLWLAVERTRLGAQLRAAVDNPSNT